MKEKYKQLLELRFSTQAIENGHHCRESRFNEFRERVDSTLPPKRILAALITGGTPQGNMYWIDLLF